LFYGTDIFKQRYMTEMARLDAQLRTNGILHRPSLGRIIVALLGFVLFAQAKAQPLDQSIFGIQPFVATPGQAFYLDLDSAPGQFSQWRHEDLGSLNGLRAIVSVPRLRTDSKWGAAFTIYLQSKDDMKSANSLGLQLVALDRNPPLTMRLVGRRNGMPIPQIQLQTTLELKERS
jgi:hypothetical protein